MLKHFMALLHLGRQSGYITLMSVLVVSAIGLTIALSLILLGLGSGKSALVLEKSAQARNIASACAESALQQIRDDNAYVGTGNLTLSPGNCSFTIANSGGENRLITVTSQVSTVKKNLRITIDAINPIINIATWQEVSDL